MAAAIVIDSLMLRFDRQVLHRGIDVTALLAELSGSRVRVALDAADGRLLHTGTLRFVRARGELQLRENGTLTCVAVDDVASLWQVQQVQFVPASARARRSR